jgi:hypothetical protein
MLLLCANFSARAHEETRNIYVGDIITLEISAQKLSEEELRQKLQDYEIVDIKNNESGYLVSIRTFNTGERKILIGDKEIVISVVSTLDDISRDDIFEGDKNVAKSGFPFFWCVQFYIAAGIFALSGGFILMKVINKKISKPESPYQTFRRRANALFAEDDNYFVDLTYYFKKYLESLYKRRIIGKTSTEIVSELKDISVLETRMPDIGEWLTKCDMWKFSGVMASTDDKRSHYERLLSLAEKIELNQNKVTT